jgi:predicted dehydrogenase
MEAGLRALLIEKPIAHNVESARRILRAAKKHGTKVMVGHVERFNPAVRKFKEIVGEYTPVQIGFVRVGPLPPKTPAGGVLVDLAIHDIDILRYVFGKFPDRYGGVLRKDKAGVDHAAMVFFQWRESALSGYLLADWLTPFKLREIRLCAEEGFLHVDFIAQTITLRKYVDASTYATKTVPVRHAEPLFLELSEFVAAVLQEKAMPVSAEDAFAALGFAYAVREKLWS